MRIAISGTACQGKSTLVKDFLEQWPSYTTPEKTYRDIIAENNLEHSSKTNKKTQRKILDFQIEEQQKYRRGDNVIFDRCPLDNLVYSMWACEQEGNDIDEEFVSSCIPLVRESFRDLDIIFFVPITKVAPIGIVEDGIRDTSQQIIEEIDNIFKAVHRDHEENPKTNIFIVDDKPPIIEVFGNRRERIEILKLYIDAEGDAMSPGNLIDEKTLESIKKLEESWSDVDPEEGSVLKKEIEKHKKLNNRLNT
jgi:nicotinamide riboside kinase